MGCERENRKRERETEREREGNIRMGSVVQKGRDGILGTGRRGHSGQEREREREREEEEEDELIERAGQSVVLI